MYLALENDLEIIPVLNKIDLPSADPAAIKAEIEAVIGLDTADALEVSAKTGQGVQEVLEAVVSRIPAPSSGTLSAPLRALVYDSWFDSYLGVVVQVRLIDGAIRPGMKIKFLNTRAEFEVYKVGVFTPWQTRTATTCQWRSRVFFGID